MKSAYQGGVLAAPLPLLIEKYSFLPNRVAGFAPGIVKVPTT